MTERTRGKTASKMSHFFSYILPPKVSETSATRWRLEIHPLSIWGHISYSNYDKCLLKSHFILFQRSISLQEYVKTRFPIHSLMGI